MDIGNSWGSSVKSETWELLSCVCMLMVQPRAGTEIKEAIIPPSPQSPSHHHYHLFLLFNHSVVSGSLRPHGLKHTRLPCPPPSPGTCLNSCLLSWWSSNHLILCCPLLLLPSIFPSIRVFSNESVLRIRRPKYWSFSFNISPSNEYSGLISFRMNWFDLLAVQGTLKSLLQHHSSKASILRLSASFVVQLSHPYMTTGKIMALTRWTFVGKVMSLFFNTLSRFVTAFLPRSKCLTFMAAVTICSAFGAHKNKVCHCFHCFPLWL